MFYCPSAVFQPLYTNNYALNPAETGSKWALSDQDRVATWDSTAGTQHGMSSRKATVKRYLEAKLESGGGANFGFGFAKDSFVYTNNDGRIGASVNSWGVNSVGLTLVGGGSQGTYATWAVGDRLMFAIDPATGKIWYGVNGTWTNSGNPGAGTGQVYTGIDTSVRFGLSFDTLAGVAAAARTYWTAIEHLYAAPSGFTAWDS